MKPRGLVGPFYEPGRVLILKAKRSMTVTEVVMFSEHAGRFIPLWRDLETRHFKKDNTLHATIGPAKGVKVDYLRALWKPPFWFLVRKSYP